MPNKMLIDATHPEETRVVVLRGNRVEEFDFESANRKQLRGNIYLAKVTRVEPSLQAAFVDYGGNRHGFLAFSEIHPDYYQIPVADRQALIDEEERAQREADAEADNYARRRAERGQSASRRQRADHQRAASTTTRATTTTAATTAMRWRREPTMMVPPARCRRAPTRAARSADHRAAEVTPAEALAVTAADETPIDLAQLQIEQRRRFRPRREPTSRWPAAAEQPAMEGERRERRTADRRRRR